MQLQTDNILHIECEKHTIDVPLIEMELDASATDHDVRRAVALMLEVPVRALRRHKIVRHASGDLSLRSHEVK